MALSDKKVNALSLSGNELRAAEELLSQFDQLETIGTYSFVWPVDNFTKLNKGRVQSPKFKTDDDYTWRLVLYPKSTTAENSIGLFLENLDCKNKTSSKDARVAVAIRIMDAQDSTRFFSKVFHNRLNHHEADWGYYDFMKLDILFDVEQPYVVNDKLVIEYIIQLKRDPTGVLWHSFKVYDSKKTTGYVGLYNQGATCYMNSLFQSLFFTNIFRKSVYQIPTENDNPQNSVALALQRLFYNLQFSESAVSTTESYIKCINVDYESSRSEEFYDIQLNVKGCQDLKESFENYIREEILEKENKYMSEGYGLQDAKKGVVFEIFPPVLHIQLKRFDYDMDKNAMVKINDRQEFSPEIDLQPYHISIEEQSQSQQASSFNYVLHGVLVHSGTISNGHYFAFVRPTKEDQWFEFNDERVGPATLNEVFEANFGGQPAHTKTPKVKRETNAYMLVYIRDSSQDQVLAPVTIDDIPHHLLERIENEKKMVEAIEKQRAEQRMYMPVYIVSDTGFLKNRGIGFINDQAQNELCPYQETRWLRRTTVGGFLQQFTAASNRDINDTRIWIIDPRQEDERLPPRPINLLPAELYNSLSLQGLCRDEAYQFLRLYIEHCPIHEAPTDPEDILLFVKYYDPVTQTLRGIGKMYVSCDASFRMIESNLITMVGLERGAKLDMYQENDIYKLEELVPSYSIHDYYFISGDIICFQRRPEPWQIADLLRAGKCPDAPSYYEILLSEVNIQFKSRDSVYQQVHQVPFILTLYSSMSIPQVIVEVARHLQQNPDHIQLLCPTDLANPLLKGIPRSSYLRNALRMCPDYNAEHDENDVFYLKRMEWTLYYDVLPMSLADTRGKSIYRINVCSTPNQPQTKALLLSKNALVSEMCHLINPREKIRVFKVNDGSTVEIIGRRCTVSHWLESDADNVYAETYDPTIEDSYRKQVVIDDYPCVLEVLDTAGQEEYTALRDQWIRDGEGFLIVYSITSRSTYDRVNKFRDQIFRVKDLTKVPLILVGNKCDKVTDREVTREEGAIKARTLNCDFVETSAKTCVNVERSFYSVVRLIRQAREGFQDGSQKNKKTRRIRNAISSKTKPIHY
ncbi:unnamed protein product [Mucor fragilis]